MSNNSLFNKNVFKSDFMRQHTLYVFYILLVVGPPFFLLDIELPFKAGNVDNAAELFHFCALTIMPTFLAFKQFVYLTKPNWLSYIHSLAVTRRQLLFSKLLNGLIILVSPLVLFYFLGNLNTETTQTFLSKEYFLSSTLLVILIYLFSVFAIISFKHLAKAFGFLVFFNIFPLLATELLRVNQLTYWKGFYAIQTEANIGISNVLAYRFFNNTLLLDHHLSFYMLFVFMILALIIVNFYSYCKQKDERFDSPLYLRQLIEFGLVFTLTLTGALYFSHMKWYPGWGYLAGALIAEGTIAVALNRKIVIKQMRWVGVASLVILCQLVFITDISGFEDRVPHPDQVEQVVFDNKSKYDTDLAYNSPEMIEKIISLHQQVLDEPTLGNEYDQLVLDYTLKNHRHIIRRYTINKALFEDEYRAMIETSEYKQRAYASFYREPSQVGSVTISSFIFDKTFELEGQTTISQLMGHLKDDLNQASADDLVFKAYDLGQITFYDQAGNMLSVDPILAHFESTKSWLDERGILSEIAVIPRNIDHIRMEYKGNDILKPDQIILDNEQYFKDILDHISGGSYAISDDYYTVGIYLKSDLDFVVLAYIDSDDLSEAFKERYFK